MTIHDDALSAFRNVYDTKLTELEIQLALKANEVAARDASIAERDNHITLLNTRIFELEAELEVANENLRVALAERDAARANVIRLADEVDQATVVIDNLNLKITELQANLNNVVAERNAALEKLATCQSNLQLTQTRLANVRADLTEARNWDSARTVFRLVGFRGEGLDIALGVAWAESLGFEDAVGDTTLVDAKWGPSTGLFQVRSLREPLEFAAVDRWRYSWTLRHRCGNAEAALAISRGGTDWTPWSTFNSGAYLEFKGQDFQIRTGHPRANLWNV